MDEELLGLALVVVLAVGAQLLGARLTIPAILPLLVAGVLAGDVTGLVDPEALLGPALDPAIQIAVGIILFEGALGLRREELAGGLRSAVVRLVSIGALLTWALMAVAIVVVLDLPHNVGILLGAILIVSGPTVVLPMLEFIRPVASTRSLLKWEGILIDPIGAILAVMAFNALDFGGGAFALQGDFVLTMLAGLTAGVAGALVLMPLLGAGWLAERQKVAATLMAVVAAFAAGDLLRQDAGLVATIVMGVVLANQRRVDVARIVEFKETLGAILLGLLFVLLAAQVDVSDVVGLGWEGIAVVLIAVLLVRPLVVLASTLRTRVPWRERAFAAGLAPRGIVAASTAAVFGVALVDQGVEGADAIVPVTFLVIAGTVALYAVAAPLLAGGLGLIHAEPAGVLLIGAPPWALALGRALREAGADVRVWSPRGEETEAARAAGLAVEPDPLLDDDDASSPLAEEIGAVLVVSDDDALNDALVVRLADALGGARVHALAPDPRRPVTISRPRELGPPLFARGATSAELARRFAAGQRMRTFVATSEHVGSDDDVLALVAVREGRNGALGVHPFTPDRPPPPVRPGDVVIALAPV